MIRFSVIIVSWNALDHLQTFLPGVVQTNYSDFEIILADNASTDGSAEWVRSAFPTVKIAALDRNYGYCGGNNRAVPYATGDVLIFLNNDVDVDPAWLTHLARSFEADSDVAAVQPKMRAYEDPEYFEYAGAAGGYLDAYGFPFCRGRLFDSVEKDTGQYDDSAEIFWASGAALAIRKEIFQKLGGFDEDFEFHMEEIDLCWRLWNRGYTVHFAPESIVYHLGGGSLPMNSPRKAYYNYRNSLAMLWKNYHTAALITRIPVRLLFDVAAAFRELISGRFRFFYAIVRGHLHFYASLSKIHIKRKALRAERIVPGDPRPIYTKSVVIDYFLKKKRKFTQLNCK